MRIVSLISSATEILCELGLQDQLVGISHECDYPESIKGLPVVSEPKINPALDAAEIDRQVRDIVREGLSVYRIKTDVLASLEPDLIVTQDQCEVCAVSLKDVEEAVCGLTLRKTKICSLKPYVLSDIIDDFKRVGIATGVPEQAEALSNRFRARLENVSSRVDAARTIPRAAMIEWLDPVIIAGGWVPELVRLAGGVPVIVGGPEPFKKVEWQEVRRANPDHAILMPCGYPIEKTLSEMGKSQILAELIRLPAVSQGQCYVADGNAYFNRPGPRIADSCEILAAIFHPKLCPDLVEKYSKAYVPWSVA